MDNNKQVYAILIKDKMSHKKGDLFHLTINMNFPSFVRFVYKIVNGEQQGYGFDWEREKPGLCLKDFKLLDESNKLYKLIMT